MPRLYPLQVSRAGHTDVQGNADVWGNGGHARCKFSPMGAQIFWQFSGTHVFGTALLTNSWKLDAHDMRVGIRPSVQRPSPVHVLRAAATMSWRRSPLSRQFSIESP